MTLQEKTDYIREAAMTEARKKANAVIEQHRQSLEHVLMQHEEEARRQAETRIKAETVGARQQLNIASSRAQLELKRELGNTQKKLKKELFDEVRRQMDEYMKSEDYRELLIRYIENAAHFADGAAMTIYINPSDEDKKAFLEEHTGMTLTVSREDFIGGVRAVVQERNILIDHAFKGGLEREYRNFVFEGGTAVG